MVLAFSIVASAAVEAKSGAEAVRAGLPREFCGTFQWDGDAELQEVFVRLSRTQVDKGGRIVAFGKGRYVTDSVTTHIQVKWLIEPQSGRFEMWEENPSQPAFTTDGSHVGAIADRLTSVEARWTTRGSGNQGTLRLHSCSAATSLLQWQDLMKTPERSSKALRR
jgi:hypothetical protein